MNDTQAALQVPQDVRDLASKTAVAAPQKLWLDPRGQAASRAATRAAWGRVARRRWVAVGRG